MTSVVKLSNAVFRTLENQKANLFKFPISIDIKESQRWAITGHLKVPLLQVLAGQHVAEPPSDGRVYPFLQKKAWPSQVVQYIEFGNTNVKASHLSARYEHYRDEFDENVGEMLRSVNSDPNQINRVVDLCELEGLQDRWVVGLSNGQSRRFRLAKALLTNPRLLLIDEPFLGLDPHSRHNISNVLSALPPSPHVILGLRYQDEFPDWITNVAIITDDGLFQGTREEMEPEISRMRAAQVQSVGSKSDSSQAKDKRNLELKDKPQVIYLDSISVSYRGQKVLSDLTWEVKEGERWHLRGDNGSGKSTLLSLLTADHPQSWNSKIQLFQEPRETGKTDYFSTNDKIGHCSPEIHAIFPGKLTVRQAISTGFVSGSFIPPNDLSFQQSEDIDNFIDKFELDPEARFNELTVNDQKTVLFLRAIVKKPKILILDEAFSTMSEVRVQKCKDMVDSLTDTTVIAISHIKEEIPDCDKFIQLKKNSYEIGKVEHDD